MIHNKQRRNPNTPSLKKLSRKQIDYLRRSKVQYHFVNIVREIAPEQFPVFLQEARGKALAGSQRNDLAYRQRRYALSTKIDATFTKLVARHAPNRFPVILAEAKRRARDFQKSKRKVSAAPSLAQGT